MRQHYNVPMGKGMALVLVCFLAVLAALMFLQPSSQESALDALSAVEKVVDQVKGPDAPAKLDLARQMLTDLKVTKASQAEKDKAIAAINDAKADLGTDQAKLMAATGEIKAQIARAKANLKVLTATERARGIKDQILALVWPLFLALLIIYVTNSNSCLRLFTQLGSVISNVKVPGGLEIAFAGTTVKNTQEEVLRGYRQQAIAQYDAAVSQFQISETVSRIIDARIKPFFEKAGLEPDFRCTVHVRDILFKDSLYQLIDYLPGKWGSGNRGRAWSFRYGIIGRCWRLEKSDAKGEIPQGQTKLIDQWGMSKVEAEKGSKQSMLCNLIRGRNQSPVAILFLDAQPPHAFGDEAKMSELIGVVDSAVKEFGLDTALDSVWEQVRSSAPLIEIYAERK